MTAFGDSAEKPDSATIGGRIGEVENGRAAERRGLTGRLPPSGDRSHPGAVDGDLGRVRGPWLTAPAVAPARRTGVSLSLLMALARKTASVSRGPYCSIPAVEPYVDDVVLYVSMPCGGRSAARGGYQAETKREAPTRYRRFQQTSTSRTQKEKPGP